MAELMWRQNNGVPRLLKPVEYDENGLSWTDVANSPDAQEALNLEPVPYPEYDVSTEQPVWNEANEEWDIVPWMPPRGLRVTKSDFSRLFTFEQRGKLEVLEYQANTANLTDPVQAARFVPVKVMFRSFNLPAEFIELDHPETAQSFYGILIPEGVVDQAEAERILSNIPPPPPEPVE